jgi:hypothetical protein
MTLKWIVTPGFFGFLFSLPGYQASVFALLLTSTMMCHHRLSGKANQSWSETSKTMRFNKPFLSVS